MPVEPIGHLSGRAGPDAFRAAFPRCVNASPKEYRALYQGATAGTAS